jgi:hypothetical protein
MSKLSRETVSLLERGRGGTPLTPAHRARLKGAILAKAAGGAVVTTATSAAAWTSGAAKIAGALLLVAAATGAGVAIGARVVDRRAQSLRLHPVGAPADVRPGVLASAASSRLTAPAPASTSSLAARPTSPPPSTSNAPPTFPLSRPSPPAPIASSVPNVGSPISSAATTPAPSAIAASLNANSTSNPAVSPALAEPAPSTLPLSTLEQDARLLGEADVALKSGDPDRALVLLAEHAAAFPRSELEPERSAERVFALCRAGRVEEARNEASAFLRAYPTGPLSARVKGACGAAGD